MKILKPMSLGILHKPYRFEGRDRLVIVALGFFPLGEARPGLLDEARQWPRIIPRLPADQPLDMVMPKPHAEILAAATAHAPDGQPVQGMDVRLQMAGIDKRLRITGDREWAYGLIPLHQISDPKPFTALPLDYSRAYGGPEHPGNPLGRGHTGSRLGAFIGTNQGLLPNVEYPARPARQHHAAQEPAGFGPLDVRWSQRNGKAGTYDQRWLEHHAPGLPPDIDWSVFNAAPADQQLPGYLAGGEPYRLEGLHPEHAILTGRLPALRPRAFLTRQGENPEQAEEVPLHFDTVWLFPDELLGVALYRGETEVAASDADDVAALLLAYEDQDQPPRTPDHYRATLVQRLATGREAGLAMLDESPLKPAPDAARQARLEQEQRDEEARVQAQSQAQLDAVLDEIRAQGGLPDDFTPPAIEPPPFGVIPRAALERGEADLSATFARIDAKLAEVQAEAAARREEMQTELANLEAQVGPQETPAEDETQAALARARGEVRRQQAEQLQDALAAGGEEGAAEQARVDALLRDLPDLERQGRLAAQEPVPAPLGDAAARALGAEVRRLLEQGQSLAGRDLAGAHLVGLNLAGLNLRGVMLERADLSGADLSGADLNGAVLAGAILDRACLADCRLEGASLNGAQARRADFRRIHAPRLQASQACLAGADFSGAQLDHFIAHRADLSGAILAGAAMQRALFLELQAADSDWRGATLEQCVLLRADLTRANFEAARLNACVWPETAAPDARLAGAQLQQCYFGATRMAGADLSQVQARACGWRQAQLSGANLEAGRFDQCDFGLADLSQSRLANARLTRSLLGRARLQGAQARGLNLFQSQCRMTDFRAADLEGAGFALADLAEADLRDARLRDARHLPSPLPKVKPEARP